MGPEKAKTGSENPFPVEGSGSKTDPLKPKNGYIVSQLIPSLVKDLELFKRLDDGEELFIEINLPSESTTIGYMSGFTVSSNSELSYEPYVFSIILAAGYLDDGEDMENISSRRDIFFYTDGLDEEVNFEKRTLVISEFNYAGDKETYEENEHVKKMLDNCRDYLLDDDIDLELPYETVKAQKNSGSFYYYYEGSKFKPMLVATSSSESIIMGFLENPLINARLKLNEPAYLKMPKLLDSGEYLSAYIRVDKFVGDIPKSILEEDDSYVPFGYITVESENNENKTSILLRLDKELSKDCPWNYTDIIKFLYTNKTEGLEPLWTNLVG